MGLDYDKIDYSGIDHGNWNDAEYQGIRDKMQRVVFGMSAKGHERHGRARSSRDARSGPTSTRTSRSPSFCRGPATTTWTASPYR